MVRLLIFIFALNAFITPVSAVGVCDMADKSNTAEMTLPMSSSISGDMIDIDCEMDENTSCSSVECISNCFATTALQLISERLTPIIVADHDQPRANFAYFYKIVHPVNTPPPLV